MKTLKFKVSKALKQPIVVTEIRRPEPDAVLVLRAGETVTLSEDEFKFITQNSQFDLYQRKNVLAALEVIEPLEKSEEKTEQKTEQKTVVPPVKKPEEKKEEVTDEKK